MTAGEDLIRDIQDCQVAHGECALWWMGQHGFIIKLGAAVIYIDVYFSSIPQRRVAPLLTPEQATNADWVLGTHDHSDHIDRPAWHVIAKSSPKARFVVPLLMQKRLVKLIPLPDNRLLGAEAGSPVSADGINVSAVPAAHEFLDLDPDTGRHPYVGYIIEGNGFRLYHSGDTCLYEGIHNNLRGRPLDLMMLPINGRDARRYKAQCIGNMTYQEAADLAGSLMPGAVIPGHYDMFASNCADVNEFAEYAIVKYPGLKVLVPKHGERIILRARV
jgi:L-ascorbate 6-phosphate lactonase